MDLFLVWRLVERPYLTQVWPSEASGAVASCPIPTMPHRLTSRGLLLLLQVGSFTHPSPPAPTEA